MDVMDCLFIFRAACRCGEREMWEVWELEFVYCFRASHVWDLI
jgi:hypothetical protein